MSLMSLIVESLIVETFYKRNVGLSGLLLKEGAIRVYSMIGGRQSLFSKLVMVFKTKMEILFYFLPKSQLTKIKKKLSRCEGPSISLKGMDVCGSALEPFTLYP